MEPREYTAKLFPCRFCPENPVFNSHDGLCRHVADGHPPTGGGQQNQPDANCSISGGVDELRTENKGRETAQDLQMLLEKYSKETKAAQDHQAVFTSYGALLDTYYRYLLLLFRATDTEQQVIASRLPRDIWKLCLFPCLKTLQQSLPDSQVPMVKFIAQALSTTFELYEAVPHYKQAWTRYMGSLYQRMAKLVDRNTSDDICLPMAEYWYLLAFQTNPYIPQTYINLASLSKDVLTQFYYSSKATCTHWPLPGLRTHVRTFLSTCDWRQIPSPLRHFLRAHISICARSNTQAEMVTKFLDRCSKKFKDPPNMLTIDGSYIAICNVAAMLGLGSEDSLLSFAISFKHAERLHNGILEYFLLQASNYPDNPCLWSFIHCSLVFIQYMTNSEGIKLLEVNFPWLRLVENLNSLPAVSSAVSDKLFPRHHQVFSEDRAMRGLYWANGYLPTTWYNDKVSGYKDRGQTSTTERKERIHWLGQCLAQCGKWIHYDTETCLFSVV